MCFFMSKGRWLKSCVALVVFCFSLLLVCISPVFAATDPIDYNAAHAMTIFAEEIYPGHSDSSVDPIRLGRSFSLPLFDLYGIGVIKDQSFASYGIAWQSLQFEPFESDVSLVLGFTIFSSPSSSSNSVSATSYSSNYYCNVTDSYFRRDNAGTVIQTTVKGTWLNGGIVDNGTPSYAPYIVASYKLPAGTNGVSARRYYWKDITATGDALVSVNCAYVVHSTDDAVVSAVNDILTQVKSINSNTAAINTNLKSCLTALNGILAECNSLNADTDTIINILNAVKSQLVTLNGKVDDIYTLLKDSLKTETAAVDKQAEETANQIMQRVDSEQYWEDKNTETFEALDMGNWSFGTGVVGSLPTVSNLFKGLWDSFGEAVLIFTFPLMLGLALVVIGRISRHSGKGGKNGGDSA